jgi:hypothetical protein
MGLIDANEDVQPRLAAAGLELDNEAYAPVTPLSSACVFANETRRGGSDWNLGRVSSIKPKDSILDGAIKRRNARYQLLSRTIWSGGTHKERTDSLVIKTGARTRQAPI